LLSEHTHDDPRRPGACAAGDAITGDMVWGIKGNGGGQGPAAMSEVAIGR
jgi:hypothetical protein